MHFLGAPPLLAAGGRRAFRLIASSVRTNFAEERGEVDFSPPLAQFGSTHAARLLLVAWVTTYIPGARPAAPVCQALPAGAPVAGLTVRCFQMGGSAARRGRAPAVRASRVPARRPRGIQLSRPPAAAFISGGQRASRGAPLAPGEQGWGVVAGLGGLGGARRAREACGPRAATRRCFAQGHKGAEDS